jgi:hypothetical protein
MTLRPVSALINDLYAATGDDARAAREAVYAVKRYWHGRSYVGPEAPLPTARQYLDLLMALAGWLSRAGLGGYTLSLYQLRTTEANHTTFAAGLTCSGALLSAAPVTQDQLLSARRDADGLLNILLGELERMAEAQGGSPWVHNEFDQEAWETLRGLPKKLLLYMRDKDRARITDVCASVWGKPYRGADGVTDDAFDRQQGLANKFLQQVSHDRLLSRSGEYLVWA